MPLDKVFPQKKEGTFSKVNPLSIKATKNAIQTAVAQGADAKAAEFVAMGNLKKLTKDESVPGKRGFHTLTLPDRTETTLTGRARRKTARKMPKGLVVQRICAVVVRPIGSKKGLGTRRRR